MKASELKSLLNSLPEGSDPDIVTGEAWLPERLIDTSQDGEMMFLHFDSAPEETQGEEEGRGFVEHEVAMIRHRFEQILEESSDTKTKADAMLALFLMGHELSSSDIIEILEDPEVPEPPTE
ncbi:MULTISPECIES: hypothetical protein [unclassified Vibrio]|uniref:hypothetical protein n=1 Tax=unclassified Vibrio TaxID=2614977 RepID=UPI0011107AF6|nr:hypothetical protein [Vibrio sp. Hep-1b-8]TMX32570.1 hypothetical protein DA100_17430 [Vibrio sp. Hep-1b-8]